MLQAIKQTCQKYYDQIPANALPVIGKSALYSFALPLIRVDHTQPYDIVRPMVNGTLAALAACIYCLTAPIFNSIFGDNQHYFHREILKLIVVNELTALSWSALTTGRVGLTALRVVKILPWHYMLASFDMLPRIFDYIDPRLAQDTRKAYIWLGMNLVPGTASIQIALFN